MSSSQDLHVFLDEYTDRHPDDVLQIEQPVSLDQEITALVWEMALRGDDRMLLIERTREAAVRVVTNVFASRRRIERVLGAEPGGIHDRFEELASQATEPREVASGPILETVMEGDSVDLTTLPLIVHFDGDAGPYITSGIIVAEDATTGAGNLSYHRATPAGRRELATSLHSRGDLWRLYQTAAARGEVLRVAMVIGAHPLFMLSASARVPMGVDERHLAGGLFGEPLEVVRTPRYGIGVPATAEVVLEGYIDPAARADEGPFGEFSGYSSDRSTNDLLTVETMMRRSDAIWLDVVGGNSADHLNLARVPRESEMATKLKQRFPSITRVHYPNSGTHFHCYVALDQRRPGEARQVMLGLLGWDPYLKTVIAVDSDVDITDDSQVLWAVATCLQPARDVLIVDGLPGSALDPSASSAGTTSRMGLDATRGPDFTAARIEISEEARTAAADFLHAQRNDRG